MMRKKCAFQDLRVTLSTGTADRHMNDMRSDFQAMMTQWNERQLVVGSEDCSGTKWVATYQCLN